MLRKTKAIPAAGIVLAVLLGGCSSSAPSEPPAGGKADALTDVDVSDASAEQAAEISDRMATADEYRAAFQRYRECLSAAGFELTDLDPTGSVYEYAVPDAAVEDGADAECYDAEFRYVDMLWQTAEDVQNSSDTAQLHRECLQERGIEPADTLEQMSEQLREAGIELPECLS
ncbi:hypothetical protein [Georgenia sp. SUBG003]|uniref:hypothetical protein n=1 Tax=Georgenia sp. SUBG003 TaxID=1497974 RepID=UPI003AB6CDE3